MKPSNIFLLFFVTVLMSGCSNLTPDAKSIMPLRQLNNSWYVDGKNKINDKKYFGQAKNIILFVGDGMGVSTVTAARILDGQQRGLHGEENSLSFDRFPHTAMSKTYNVNAQTPDSAGTMTAMVTGVKTNAGVISVDESVTPGKCESSADGNLISALELAELAGKSTGVISTARITHATPAATYAKSPLRHWEGISAMPTEAQTAGCEDIASQLISFERRLRQRFPNATNIDGVEVVMGGGRRHFLPKDASGDEHGTRDDNRNLVQEWKTAHPNGKYLSSGSELASNELSRSSHILGLFSDSHLDYEADRLASQSDEPTLAAMTAQAINKLSTDKDGFFLMVEAGRIDHGHHQNSAYYALNDTIALSQAVDAALSMVDLDETLIIVTADHSHVFTIAGYPKRGNPILGKVVNIGDDTPALAQDGKPYTTLGYANGKTYTNDSSEKLTKDLFKQAVESQNIEVHNMERADLSDIDTEGAHFHQQSLIPLGIETHGGEDVVIYGNGIGSSLVKGTLEQNVIFHIINHVGALDYLAAKRLSN